MRVLPRASVIINNYNYARFLREAIESALRQTYPDTEVIVVDDGSTDNSRDVIRSFGDRIVPVFKENGGQGSAFNAGFAASTGDFVCFLDSDDTLFPDAISAAEAAFRDEGIIKVEWKLCVVDENGGRSGCSIPERPLPSDVRELTLRDGPFYDWLITPPSSGNCYRRTFLQQVLPMTEQEFRHGADVCLTILAPLYGNILRLSEPQGTYRQHDANNFYGRRLDERRIHDYMRRFESCCDVLSTHVQALALPADPEQWRQRNFNYLWPQRLLRARQDLSAIVPAGQSYILIDNNEWDEREQIPGRHAIPFLERDGNYDGPPEDDRQAIFELERLRLAGASTLAIWWTAFWWLDHYQGFASYLRSRFQQVLNDEHLLVFNLQNESRR